jgi:hypothetical protein
MFLCRIRDSAIIEQPVTLGKCDRNEEAIGTNLTEIKQARISKSQVRPMTIVLFDIRSVNND